MIYRCAARAIAVVWWISAATCLETGEHVHGWNLLFHVAVTMVFLLGGAFCWELAEELRR